MFGMLSPARHSREYRSVYARCCGHHRRVNGISALPWLSYEAVLLYQMAADAGAVDVADLPRVRCCKLRPLPTPLADRGVGEFCAHVGSLLASIKVEDDVRDGGSIRSRIVAWLYRHRFSATHRYFARLDPGFSSFVEAIISEHLALERPGRDVSLCDYVGPTATAFRHVFSLMARMPGLHQRADLLREVGECVGAAIIAFDCAVDRDRDVRRGDFNPLAPGPEAIQDALEFSRDRLAQARQRCAEAFGPQALTVQTLDGVIDRVMNIGRKFACPKCSVEMIRSMQNWGLSPRPGAVQLNSFLGLGGLVALVVGLAIKLMSSAPSPGPIPPIDPNAVVQQPPPPIPPVPPRASTGAPADCSTSLSCCDGTQCCCETSSCAMDNTCDGFDCSGCDGCGDCGSGCSGCDVSC